MTPRHPDPPLAWTVDVFDTVLTRRVAAPEAAFIIVGERLLSNSFIRVPAASFAHIRHSVEHRLRHGSASGEVTLTEIYAELTRVGDIHADAEEAAQVELAVEEALLVPVPGAATKLMAKRAAGARICFLSDTYYPAAWLLERLREHGMLATDDVVITSCEAGASKATGRLFPVALSRLGLSSGEVTHVGNDLRSDVLQPRRHGIRAVHEEQANLNRYELALEGLRGETAGLSSLIAGASRLTRLSIDAGDEHDATIRDVTAGVAGPVVSSFVLWLLLTAQASGLRRLYFVSHDGDVLHRVATAVAPALSDEVPELRYLHGGRQAWHLPSFVAPDDFTESWLFRDAAGSSPRELLARVEMSPSDQGVPDILRRLPADDPLGSGAPAVIAAVRSSSGFWDAVAERASQARELTLAYLKQEGLLDDERIGVVDVGWAGRASSSLDRLVEKRASSLHHFFFGLNYSARDYAPQNAQAFYADGRHGSGAPLEAPFTLLEVFCPGRHGPVLGYRPGPDGRVLPRLAAPGNDAIDRWGAPVLHDAIDDFAAHLVDSLLAVAHRTRPGHAALVSIAHQVLELLWRAPSPLEAQVWGAYPHDEGQGGLSPATLAPPLRAAGLLVASGAAERGSLSHRSRWPAASLAASSPSLAFAYRLRKGLLRRVRMLRSS